jgi:hypothetical protein
MLDQPPRVDDRAFRNRRLRKPENVLAQTVGDESVLLNLDTEHYFGLDPIGTDMWQALVATDSIGAAFDELEARYEVSPEVLWQDLAALVDALLASGLLLDEP